MKRRQTPRPAARSSRPGWVFPIVAIGLVPALALAGPPIQTPEAEADGASDTETSADASPTATEQPATEQPETEQPEPEPQTAAEWYARGYTLGKRGDNEAAAEAFLRSYELQPTSEALYNAALAYENAKAHVAAITTYRRFLAEPEPKPELVPVAERSIEALLPEVGVVKGVRYDEAQIPSELRVNGRVVALDAFPIVVTPGEVVITVVDGSGTAREESYELLAGESLVLDLRALLPAPAVVEPEPGPEPGPESGPDPKAQAEARARAERDAARAQRLRVASFGLTGVAGGAAIATIVTGVLAAGARRELLAETCYEFEDGICPPDFMIGDPGFHNRNYERLALATTVTGSVAAGLAVGALITGLISLRLRRRAAQVEGARIELEPGPGGLALRF